MRFAGFWQGAGGVVYRHGANGSAEQCAGSGEPTLEHVSHTPSCCRLFLLFLILALANPRWGQVSESRRVAIVLDTSIWSQVQRPGEPSWIDSVRRDAYRFLNTLPPTDEVLLLRAEPDALPILPFTHDRSEQLRAVAQARSSSSIADIPRALEAGKAALAGSRL